jgi:hypothetical protein
MENQQFTMQTPEYIAKFYGGDKQKILQALQSGALGKYAKPPFDQTLAAAAAGFIDQVRAAAQTEQAPQQTVFQQLFAPPAPQQAPMGAPAGLGATPQAAAMPPQEMGPPPQGMPPQEMAPPQEMPAMADGGMVPPYATGGLSDLPVPDAMFDEPNNGGYAGGGIIAFSGGGSTPTNYGAFIEQKALAMFPNLQITGRARTAERNAEVGGVPDSYHKIDAARDIKVPPGMTKAEFITQLKGGFGAEYDILPSGGNSVHIEPGPTLGRKVRSGQAAPATAGKELVADAQGDNTVYGLPTNLSGNIDLIKSLMPKRSEEDLEYSEELKKKLSPEERAQSKKDAALKGIAQWAKRLGESKSPTLLGGLGETLGAGAVDMAESLEADEKRIRELHRERAQIANLSRKEEMDAIAMGVDLNKTAATLDQGIKTLEADKVYKDALLTIERAKVSNQLEQILAESKSKENTKERFIETYYKVLIDQGHSETYARQVAYKSAEIELARIAQKYGPKTDDDSQAPAFQKQLDQKKGTGPKVINVGTITTQ